MNKIFETKKIPHRQKYKKVLAVILVFFYVTEMILTQIKSVLCDSPYEDGQSFAVGHVCLLLGLAFALLQQIWS